MIKEIWTIEYKENNSNKPYEVIKHGIIKIYSKDFISLLHLQAIILFFENFILSLKRSITLASFIGTPTSLS